MKKAQERIARLEALLQRIGTRATEPRARRVERLSATAYDDIQDEIVDAHAAPSVDADDASDAHAITDRHGARPDSGSAMPKSFGSTGWTMPPEPEPASAAVAHEMTTKATREMNAVKPGSEDGRVPNTRQLARQGMIPAMPPPPLIRESLMPEVYTAPEAERVPESEPPPISAPMFTPRPPAPPIEVAASYPFAGEPGTLVSHDGLGTTLVDTPSEVDPDAMPEEYEMVEGVVEVEPDADDDAVRPSMLPRDAGFEDPQEITDVFESRSRLMTAPSVRPEELGELEILGEADVEDAPASSRRAIPALGSEPPASGPQVASLVPPAMASSPNSMEVVLPVAQSPGEYRSDLELPNRTIPAPSIPTPQESRTEIVRPRIDLEVKVAQAVGHTPAFQPATFGELLDATLDL